MSKIFFCYTIAETFHFSLETIIQLKESGNDITLISSDEKKLKEIAERLNVEYIYMNFSRNFSVFRDSLNLVKLYFFIRKMKPDTIIGATPKAALLSMVASFFAGTSHRIYHIFGLVYETSNGLKRSILTFVEKVTSFCATDIVPISVSLKDVYVDQFPVVRTKIRNIGILTVGGVDTDRFNMNRFISDNNVIKESIGIPCENLIIGLVGRFTNDKGLGDFIAMWELLKNERSDVVALVIGNNDTRDNFDSERLSLFFNDPKVYHINFTNEVEKYMSIMNVFVLPSYREGFGNVIAEVSSMKIPVVSYDVTGCKDSVDDGKSGLLVQKSDINGLVIAVSYFLNSDELRKIFGNNGRCYVKNNFTSKKIANQFCEFCHNLQIKN